MKSLTICFLTAIAIHSVGQEAQERILYVVDSIPIINDPDIETATVITNKNEIEKLWYKDLDKGID